MTCTVYRLRVTRARESNDVHVASAIDRRRAAIERAEPPSLIRSESFGAQGEARHGADRAEGDGAVRNSAQMRRESHPTGRPLAPPNEAERSLAEREGFEL